VLRAVLRREIMGKYRMLGSGCLYVKGHQYLDKIIIGDITVHVDRGQY